MNVNDLARAREQLTEYERAGIDLVCVYPHGLSRSEYETALGALTT